MSQRHAGAMTFVETRDGPALDMTLPPATFRR